MNGTKSKAPPNTKRKRKPQGKWIRREETNSGYTSNLKAAEDGEEHKAGTVLPANNNIIPGNFCHGSIYSGLSERERSTAELPTLKKKKKKERKRNLILAVAVISSFLFRRPHSIIFLPSPSLALYLVPGTAARARVRRWNRLVLIRK